MPAVFDLRCGKCDETWGDFIFPGEFNIMDRVVHYGCSGVVGLTYLSRRPQQWAPGSEVVVFRNPDGTYRYPGQNTVPTPPGCERVTMRSLREIHEFEKEAGVRSEVAWYDKGSGRGHEETR